MVAELEIHRGKGIRQAFDSVLGSASCLNTRGGRIDGNRKALFNPDIEVRDTTCKVWRPFKLVYFCESTYIRLEDIELVNSPYWTCFVYGCDNVFIDRVRILEETRKLGTATE